MTQTAPAVTVIITAYNVAPYLRQAVESALGQTMTDLELIVVDDGSADGGVERLRGIQDPRMRIVRQEHLGSSAARNAGLRLAQGRYVGFLDGDDVWAATKLARHVEFLERHPETDLTFSLSVTIDESGREMRLLEGRPGSTVSFQDLLVENVVRNGSAVVVRKAALDRAGCFDTGLSACTDLDMWLRIARLRHNNFYCIPETLTFYRRRARQVTSDWRRMRSAWEQMFEKMRRLSPDEVRRVEGWAYCNKYRYYAYIAYENGDLSGVMRLLWASVRYSPRKALLEPRTWLLLAAGASRLLLPSSAHRKLEDLAIRWERRLSRSPQTGPDENAGRGR